MLLNQLGIKTIRNFEFSDHHRFSEQELKDILKVKEASESEEIVTTEKDFFRCEEAIKRIVKPLILKVRLHLTNGEGLLHQYLGRFAVSRHTGNYDTRQSRFRSRRNPVAQRTHGGIPPAKAVEALPSESKVAEKETLENG